MLKYEAFDVMIVPSYRLKMPPLRVASTARIENRAFAGVVENDVHLSDIMLCLKYVHASTSVEGVGMMRVEAPLLPLPQWEA